eukprot:704782-Amorphochlora_amoeboformis.AAC.2
MSSGDRRSDFGRRRGDRSAVFTRFPPPRGREATMTKALAGCDERCFLVIDVVLAVLLYYDRFQIDRYQRGHPARLLLVPRCICSLLTIAMLKLPGLVDLGMLGRMAVITTVNRGALSTYYVSLKHEFVAHGVRNYCVCLPGHSVLNVVQLMMLYSIMVDPSKPEGFVSVDAHTSNEMAWLFVVSLAYFNLVLFLDV